MAVLALCVSALAQAQTPTITSVLNGASYGTQICPGALAEIFGTNFGIYYSSIIVMVGSKPAYVDDVAPTQISVQIPFEVAPGETTLVVALNGIASAPFNIALSTYCPAFLSADRSGTGIALAVQSSGALLGTLVTLSTPAKPGDKVSFAATGLGPTNPPLPTGSGTGPTYSTASPVSVTIGGIEIPAGNVLASSGGGGIYTIAAAIPASAQGTQPIIASVGGVSSPDAVTVPLLGITSLVSNASFGSAGTAAPGSIVSIFANGLGKIDQTTGFPSSNFQGVQVTFNGTAAPLFHLVASANPQQIDLLVPDELPASGSVDVQLTTPTTVNPHYNLTMAPAVPGLYRIQDPSLKTRFNVIAQFANTAWLALPSSTTSALGLPACLPTTNPLSECGQPASPGDYLVIYATGLGKTTQSGDPNGTPLTTGAIPPPDGSVLYETPTKPTVTIGGVPAMLLYSGLAPGFPGEYQVDLQVPSGVATGDDIPVVITMDGLSDTATISIHPHS